MALLNNIESYSKETQDSLHKFLGQIQHMLKGHHDGDVESKIDSLIGIRKAMEAIHSIIEPTKPPQQSSHGKRVGQSH